MRTCKCSRSCSLCSGSARIAAWFTIILLSTSLTASAAIIDLTTSGSSGTINGAIYEQVVGSSTGTGTIDSFAQISPGGNDPSSSAYNTTVNNTLDNGSPDNFNHSITVGEVPVVDISGTLYHQFILDVNENSGGTPSQQFVSLDEVQVFVGGTANSNVATFTGDILDHDGTLIYQMDAGADSAVGLDFQLGSGSGSGDMFLYLPRSLFAPFALSDVVTLYSEFGQLGVDPAGLPSGDYGQSDGFEEWALDEEGQLIPEPASLALALLSGLFCTGYRRRNS